MAAPASCSIPLHLRAQPCFPCTPSPSALRQRGERSPGCSALAALSRAASLKLPLSTSLHSRLYYHPHSLTFSILIPISLPYLHLQPHSHPPPHHPSTFLSLHPHPHSTPPSLPPPQSPSLFLFPSPSPSPSSSPSPSALIAVLIPIPVPAPDLIPMSLSSPSPCPLIPIPLSQPCLAVSTSCSWR